jgi:hypothetical protein
MATKNPNWGGRRKGAGAPKGNVNALKHGRYSSYYEGVARVMADLPELQPVLVSIAKQKARRRKQAEEGALDLLGDIFRRVGELVLDPHNNHLENNPEQTALVVATLRDLQQKLEELKQMQSSEESDAIN